MGCPVVPFGDHATIAGCALERMVREALLARRVEDLVQARDVLTTNSLPPMTPEEIQAEIDAYRAEVRRAARP